LEGSQRNVKLIIYSLTNRVPDQNSAHPTARHTSIDAGDSLKSEQNAIEAKNRNRRAQSLSLGVKQKSIAAGAEITAAGAAEARDISNGENPNLGPHSNSIAWRAR
jgi:hypothetical protein